jgi:hypothetical protein
MLLLQVNRPPGRRQCTGLDTGCRYIRPSTPKKEESSQRFATALQALSCYHLDQCDSPISRNHSAPDSLLESASSREAGSVSLPL